MCGRALLAVTALVMVTVAMAVSRQPKNEFSDSSSRRPADKDSPLMNTLGHELEEAAGVGRRGEMSCSGEFNVMGSSNRAGNDEEDELQEDIHGKPVADAKAATTAAKAATKAAAAATSAAKQTASDAGRPARCSKVQKDGIPGALSCIPRQEQCYDASGHVLNDEARCKKTFGSPVECPDGIGPNGVFLSKYCASWDSVPSVIGLMECVGDTKNGGTRICTKMQVEHPSATPESYGVLKMKRIACKSTGGCKVFKAGLCVDVGTNMFEYWNVKMIRARKLSSLLKQFASKAITQLKSKTAKPCDFKAYVAKNKPSKKKLLLMKTRILKAVQLD